MPLDVAKQICAEKNKHQTTVKPADRLFFFVILANDKTINNL
jgi:hypothetical protein